MTTNRTQQTENLSVLDNRQALRLDNHRPLKVQVISGTGYLTREGDGTDYVLTSGQTLCIEDRGQVVMQGLPCAKFSVIPA